MARLAKAPATITELAAPFDMSLPAMSKHIRVLERAGLVVRTVQDRVHNCALDAEHLRDAAASLDRYRTFWDDTLAALSIARTWVSTLLSVSFAVAASSESISVGRGGRGAGGGSSGNRSRGE